MTDAMKVKEALELAVAVMEVATPSQALSIAINMGRKALAALSPAALDPLADETMSNETQLREALLAAREWILSNTSGENDPSDSTMYERGWWGRDTKLMAQIDGALLAQPAPSTKGTENV
jgi:hypothetical protein